MTNPIENFVAKMMARLSHGGSQAEETETSTANKVEKVTTEETETPTTNKVEEVTAEEVEDPIFDMEVGMIVEELRKRKERGEDIENSVTVINTPEESLEVEKREKRGEKVVKKKTPFEKDQERFMKDDYSTGDPKIDRMFNKLKFDLKLEQKVKESTLKSHDRLTDMNMTTDHMLELLCEGNADAEECINELFKASETDPRAGLCIYSRIDSRGCYGKALANVWIASNRNVQEFLVNIDNWHK